MKALLFSRVIEEKHVEVCLKKLWTLSTAERKWLLSTGRVYWKVDYARALAVGDHLHTMYMSVKERKLSIATLQKRERVERVEEVKKSELVMMMMIVMVMMMMMMMIVIVMMMMMMMIVMVMMRMMMIMMVLCSSIHHKYCLSNRASINRSSIYRKLSIIMFMPVVIYLSYICIHLSI